MMNNILEDYKLSLKLVNTATIFMPYQLKINNWEKKLTFL